MNHKVFALFITMLLCMVAPVSAQFMSALVQTSAGVDANVNTYAGANANAQADASANQDSVITTDSQGRGLLEIRTAPGVISLQSRVKTDLNLTGSAEGNGEVQAQLSNGRWATIRVMPESASATAIAQSEAHCEERNCSVELKEVGKGENAVAAYDVEARQEAKVFAFIPATMKVHITVNAETGEVIEVNKPWWASISSETKSSTKVNSGATVDNSGNAGSSAGAGGEASGSASGSGGY